MQPLLRFTMLGALLVVLGATLPRSGDAQDPKVAPDDTWISVSGTVVSTTPHSFRLDYGTGVVTVEMDDFDFFEEGRLLMQDDHVTVYGVVDDDLLERRTIEASSVYVENLGTRFYASSADDEDFATWTVVGPIQLGRAEVTGTVTEVDGREFTIDDGARKLRIDTSEMSYNPMDDRGFQHIEVGDRVKVIGNVELGFFESREINADLLIELNG